MSIKKEIFQQIGAYLMYTLNDLPVELDLPGLKWFDKQMGQFNNPELFYAIPLPCILMKFENFTWQTAGKNQQRGSGILRFTIYYENYADSFAGSVNEELALKYFEFTEQVHLALQGLSLPNMSPLDRVMDNEDEAQDMIITSTVGYNTTITDRTTDISRDTVLADPALSVEYLKQTNRPDPDTFIDGFILP